MKHFYHCYAGHPAWTGIASGHVAALLADEPGDGWDVSVGLVGSRAERDEAVEWWARRMPGVEIAAEADTGWEQVTLSALRDWARLADPDEPVLYAHTKGTSRAGDPAQLGKVWRDVMTGFVVGRWRECVGKLGEVDAVGCHWLTPEENPGSVTIPYFAGNFWWARAGLVAGLPEPPVTKRGDAETWLGRGNPRVHDWQPGWPSLGMYAQETVRLLNPGSSFIS